MDFETDTQKNVAVLHTYMCIGLYIPGLGGDVQSQLVAVYGNSFLIYPSLGMYQEIHPNHDLPQGANPRWSIDTSASSDGAFG